MDHSIDLSIHGVGVRVTADTDELIGAVEHDFSFFALPDSVPAADPALRIVCESLDPDFDALPVMRSSMATPRNVCYRRDGLTYMDYGGRALNVYDREEASCRVTTRDPHLAHEIVYLTVLSRASALLERNGLHRIHALGVEVDGRGGVVLLPSGGGKTSLALRILTGGADQVRLLSEDSPLIDRSGRLVPFPLRIGVAPGTEPPDVPPERTLRIRRMEYEPKTTIDIRCFAERICPDRVPCAFLLLGQRSTGRSSAIDRVPRRVAMGHCMTHSVIGVGLYQGMEFIMQRGMRGAMRGGSRLLRRARANLRLLRHANVYRFTVGRDRDGAAETLIRFLCTPTDD